MPVRYPGCHIEQSSIRAAEDVSVVVGGGGSSSVL